MNRKTVRKLDEIMETCDNPYYRITRYLKRQRITRPKRYPNYFKFSESRRSIILDALEGVSTFNPYNKGK